MSKKDYYIEVSDDEPDDENEEISTPKKIKKEKPVFAKEERAKIKFWLIILIITVIFVFYEVILYYIQELLSANPTIHKLYVGIENEIRANSLKGLLYVSILGAVFFLTIPGEALFIYFLSRTDYFIGAVIIIVVLGNLLGLIINYGFGRILGERIIKKIFYKNHDKFEKRIHKWGGYVLFFGNIIPSPIELLTVFYGGFKYSFSKYVYLCFMGRFIKYAILFVLFFFYWDQITIIYEDAILSGFGFWERLID